MRLEESIDHLEEMLTDKNHEWTCEECREEHEQLLGWLKELNGLRLENEKVVYLCDRKKPCKEHCEKYHHCKRTSDISHAKNFRLVPNVDPITYEEVDEHCIANITFDREQLQEIVEEKVIKPIKNGELVVKKEDDKWGEWIISEIQCPNCLEYFQSDCYSMEELKKCPVCGADLIGGEQ